MKIARDRAVLSRRTIVVTQQLSFSGDHRAIKHPGVNSLLAAVTYSL